MPLDLPSFISGVHHRIDTAVEAQALHPSQRALIATVLAVHQRRALAHPTGDPLAIFHHVATAWERPLDNPQALHLGAFCALYLMAADVIDDVQDEDLAGKPLAEAGPAVALNTGLALLFLGLNELRQVSVLEPDPRQAIRFLEVFNRASLAAVRGQHLDLIGAKGARTPDEVLEMQAAKTCSLAMIAECAALWAGCSPDVCEHYRRAGTAFVQLVQVFDDLRDIMGKSRSPDLATGKITYPVATFLEHASPEAQSHFEELIGALPGSLREIRSVLYDSGAVKRSAEMIDQLRRTVHRELAATGNPHPSHRTWLQTADAFATALYIPAPVEESFAIMRPDGPWHARIRSLTDGIATNLSPLGGPSAPPVEPWGHPSYLCDFRRQMIFYPDIEGQGAEILPFQAKLLGEEDLAKVRGMVEIQAPVVLAHEFFHYWRHHTGHLTNDAWFEELIANRLALAYCREHDQGALHRTGELAGRVQANTTMEPPSRAILERLLDPDCSPDPDAGAGYGVSLEQMTAIQAAMVSALIVRDKMTLDQAVRSLV